MHARSSVILVTQNNGRLLDVYDEYKNDYESTAITSLLSSSKLDPDQALISEVLLHEEEADDDGAAKAAPGEDVSRTDRHSSFVLPYVTWRGSNPQDVMDLVYMTLTVGSDFSMASMVYQILFMFVVFLSTITYLVSTLPEFWSHNTPQGIRIIEIFVVCVFTVDYLIRLVCYRGNRLKWAVQPMQLVDVLSITPLYVEFILESSNVPVSVAGFTVFRILRLVSALWTLKITRYSKLAVVFVNALSRSRDGFILFTLNILVMMVCVSGVMFYSEQTISTFDQVTQKWYYPNGDVTPFQSIPVTFWWFMVTVTTVGYGDTFPRSNLGRFVASLTMILGILVISVPVAVFSLHFTQAWYEKLEIDKSKKRKKLKINPSLSKPEAKRKLIHIIQKKLQEFSNTIKQEEKILNKLRTQETELRQLVDLVTSVEKQEQQRSHHESQSILKDKEIQMFKPASY